MTKVMFLISLIPFTCVLYVMQDSNTSIEDDENGRSSCTSIEPNPENSLGITKPNGGLIEQVPPHLHTQALRCVLVLLIPFNLGMHLPYQMLVTCSYVLYATTFGQYQMYYEVI